MRSPLAVCRTLNRLGRVTPLFAVCLLAAFVVQPHRVDAAQEASEATHALDGASHFTFSDWNGPSMPVYTYVPPGIDQTTAPILIVMHGMQRDADKYRDQWVKPATKGGFIVVAPQFSKAAFPNSADYNQGGVFEQRSTNRRDENQWAFSAIEPLFDQVVARLGGLQTGYSIYGHSAGSQFVHRYLFFKPQARARRYLAANAGWYTFADPEIAFPYGLGGAGVSEAELKAALAKDVVVLLGDADSDPNARFLRKSKAAMRQGPHRFARGQKFFAAAKAYANARGWTFGWSLQVAEGVAHSNTDMAPKAFDLIR